jgi:hypothetical protein
MEYIRKRYPLLEIVTFCAWIFPLVVIVVVSDPKLSLAEKILNVLGLVPGGGLTLWIGFRGMLYYGLWKSDRITRLSIIIGSLGISLLFLLLLDLNAKYIVARFYTGDKKIPYAFLS